MPLQCEVCGSPIHGQPTNVNIDGGIFRVCHSCAKLGTPTMAQRPTKPPPPLMKTPPFKSPPTENELELRKDFYQVMRQARQKMGLSQEELGSKMNEKPSVVRLLESGKLKPNNLLAKKIEHFLRVEILVPPETE